MHIVVEQDSISNRQPHTAVNPHPGIMPWDFAHKLRKHMHAHGTLHANTCTCMKVKLYSYLPLHNSVCSAIKLFFMLSKLPGQRSPQPKIHPQNSRAPPCQCRPGASFISTYRYGSMLLIITIGTFIIPPIACSHGI